MNTACPYTPACMQGARPPAVSVTTVRGDFCEPASHIAPPHPNPVLPRSGRSGWNSLQRGATPLVWIGRSQHARAGVSPESLKTGLPRRLHFLAMTASYPRRRASSGVFLNACAANSQGPSLRKQLKPITRARSDRSRGRPGARPALLRARGAVRVRLRSGRCAGSQTAMRCTGGRLRHGARAAR